MFHAILDLSATDSRSDPDEYVSIDETFNPTVHRVNHAVKSRALYPERPVPVKSRALYPERPVPDVPSILLRFSHPTQDLIETVQRKVDALVEAADVKKGLFQSF